MIMRRCPHGPDRVDGRRWYACQFPYGQIRAGDSLKRFVCVFSGTQGGKTEMGPPWLLREIQLRGPGDYMIVTPTFPTDSSMSKCPEGGRSEPR